ncbi:MAG: phage tail sheath subtilisin-like domain-containing protein [Pseudomonadota bacterium]
MAVAQGFPEFPANWRVPLFYADVDPSQAGTPVIDEKSIAIGHKLTTGSAAADVAQWATSADFVASVTGAGSMVHQMAEAFFAVHPQGQLWFVPVDEPSAGVAATGTITFGGAPTEAGTLSLYIAGKRVQVAVASGAAVADIASATADAINADTFLAVTAAAALGVVTLTCKWKGLTGNDIDLRVNYLGTLGGEATPAGLTVNLAAMGSIQAGTGAPDLADAIANLGDEPYDFWAWPWTDTASLNVVQEEMKTGTGGRWAWDRQLYGGAFTAYRGSAAELQTFGVARNDPFVHVIGLPDSPSAPWQIAAAYCARSTIFLLNDPARPLNTGILNGIAGPRREYRLTGQERNTLLYNGISPTTVDDDGTVRITRSVSTYQRNQFGSPDNAFLETNTSFTLARVLRRLRARVERDFPRHKLANDGTRFGAGQAIVTPSMARSAIISEYILLEEEGLVENRQVFIDNLIVERNATDPTRLDVLFPPDLINQLHVFAVLAQYRLQYTDQALAA